MTLAKPNTRQLIIVLSIAAMFIGLMVSRAILSCSLGLFFLTLWVGIHPKINIKIFIHDPYLVLITMLFFIPVLSVLWSTDLNEWWYRSVIKLPLLLLPLAFAAMPAIGHKEYRLLSWLYILVIGAGSCWSFAMYSGNMIPMHDAYSKATVILVPFENDHIRFSWAIVIALLLLVKLLTNSIVSSKEKWVAYAMMGWFILFLHIMAAKTGLITFYLCFFIYCMSKMSAAKNKLLPIAGCLLPFCLFLIAYFLLPTFHNRVHYVLWDFHQYHKGIFLAGTSDGVRVISWKGGWQIITENVFSGIGFGDIKNHMQQFYYSSFGYLTPHDWIFPNQLLMYGCGAGIIGLIAIVCVALYPFFIQNKRNDIFFICFSAGTFICFLSDIPLEGQYGVFLYCFFAKWFSTPLTPPGFQTPAGLKSPNSNH
jgi:hypothetical protein